MTTLSCLVAWLLLYLFAFSSISQCNINGNGLNEATGGRAIGKSDGKDKNKENALQIESRLSDGIEEEERGADTEKETTIEGSSGAVEDPQELPSFAENGTNNERDRDETGGATEKSDKDLQEDPPSLSSDQTSSNSKDQIQDQSNPVPDVTTEREPTPDQTDVADVGSARSSEVDYQDAAATKSDNVPEFVDNADLRSTEVSQESFSTGKESNDEENDERTRKEESKSENIGEVRREELNLEGNIEDGVLHNEQNDVLHGNNEKGGIEEGRIERTKDEAEEGEKGIEDVTQKDEERMESEDGQKEQSQEDGPVDRLEGEQTDVKEKDTSQNVGGEIKEQKDGDELDRTTKDGQSMEDEGSTDGKQDSRDGLLEREDNGIEESADTTKEIQEEKEETVEVKETEEEKEKERDAVQSEQISDGEGEKAKEGEKDKTMEEEIKKGDEDVDLKKDGEPDEGLKKIGEPDEGVTKDEPDKEEEEDEQKEEMPSFGEWKEKMLQQAQETQDRELGKAGSGQKNPPPPPKFNLNENSKNHASADCGAKILGTNPEAQSASAILNVNRDIYMLNPCSAKAIWFTVELCEPIQVKLLELANFELFSSVPERFRVSISDRYPVREWHQLGTFSARDERALQSFPITEETMFAKYIKVEMISFFGKEHFCPLSLLRVFGTSMVEEIDEAEAAEDTELSEQDVEPITPSPVTEDSKTNGILGHAKDAVFKFVETAAKVFSGKKDDEGSEGNLDNVTQNVDAPGDSFPDTDGQSPDQTIAEDPKGTSEDKSNNSSDGFNDKCNGQVVCFQENYSREFHHCCLSLFAQTAGSILICCRALRSGTSPLEDEDKLLSAGKSSGAGLSEKELAGPPGEILETGMERTLTKLKSSILTSYVLEPTPTDKGDGGSVQESRIQSSSPPPAIVLSTSDPQESQKIVQQNDPHLEIKATSTSDAHMQRTPEPAQNVMGGTVDKAEDMDGYSKEDSVDPDKDINVLPIPSPPTVELTRTLSTEDHPRASPLDSIGQVMSEDNLDTRDIADHEPGSVESEPAVADKQMQPTEPTKTASEEASDATKPLEADGTPSKLEKSRETVKQEEGQEIDEVAQVDSTAKDSASAIPEEKSKESKADLKEVPKLEDSSDTPAVASGEKSTKEPTASEKSATVNENGNANGNGKVAANAEGIGNGMGTFSPSASSLAAGLGPLPHGTQKESVLMRLNNRIKALEINMSLSGLYLEELSQRYRKQMDEMQKAFNKKVKTLQENSQKAHENEQQAAEQIAQLKQELQETQASLDNITQRMDGMLREVVERHLFLMLCEAVIMVLVFSYCLRKTNRIIAANIPSLTASTSRPQHRSNGSLATAMGSGKSALQQPVEDVGRRNSDGLIHIPFRDGPDLSPELSMPKNKPNSKTGSLDDLLIIGPTTPLREALRQASEPTKQKGKNRNKGRHKNAANIQQQRPTSTAVLGPQKDTSPSLSSALSSLLLASFSRSSSSSPTSSTKLSLAGLLFKGSAGNADSVQVSQNKGKPQASRSVPENVGHVNGFGHKSGKSHGAFVNGYRDRSNSTGACAGGSKSGGIGGSGSKFHGSGSCIAGNKAASGGIGVSKSTGGGLGGKPSSSSVVRGSCSAGNLVSSGGSVSGRQNGNVNKAGVGGGKKSSPNMNGHGRR